LSGKGLITGNTSDDVVDSFVELPMSASVSTHTHTHVIDTHKSLSCTTPQYTTGVQQVMRIDVAY